MIEEINLFTRGWIGYFRLSTVRQPFDLLDQWRRRRLRKILWAPWRKPKTRYRRLVALGSESGACPQGDRHRPKGLVERRRLAHARRHYQSVTGAMGPPELARSDSGPVAALLNRRVRSRTHGGVGGREGRPSLPPDRRPLRSATLKTPLEHPRVHRRRPLLATRRSAAMRGLDTRIRMG